MKRFNVSILAVVAVLAIGLTAFTKAEPAGKRVTIANCYRDVTTACETPAVRLLINSTACNVSLPEVNAPVSAFASFISSIDCQQTQTVFCCAQLEAITEKLCDDQQPLTFVDYLGNPQTSKFAKIRSVTCKPALP